jgi:hypothetical protein
MSQLVKVDVGVGNVFTYRWEGVGPLYPGDHVLLPGNWRTDWEPFWGVVVDMVSDYDGPTVAILERRMR